MLDGRRPKTILVAVETAACDAALELAAAEARSRRCGVHLVHVMQPVVAGSRGMDVITMIAGDLGQVGRRVLDDAAAKLERLLSNDADLPVSTELFQGAVVPTLVAESAHACLVVVQHRGMGAAGATPVLSVTNGVAARAHAPVIAVPSLWCYDSGAPPVITVGLEDFASSSALVRTALEEAERCGGRVRLVHAVRPSRSMDADLAEVEAWRLRADRSEELSVLRARQPDVPAEVAVARARPSELLLELADSSTMLAIGRRHPRLPISKHLGSVARAALRWSPVPVLVVDPAAWDGPVASSPTGCRELARGD